MSFMNMGEEFTTLAKERAKVAELEAQVEALRRAAVADQATLKALRKGEPAPVICAWCLEVTGESGQVNTEHAENCEMSPLRGALDRIKELEEPQVGVVRCPHCDLEHDVQLSRGRINDPNERGEGVDIMLKIPGTKRHHRCDCGGNVFKKTGGGNYKCNSCALVYEGDQRWEVESDGG